MELCIKLVGNLVMVYTVIMVVKSGPLIMLISWKTENMYSDVTS